MAEAWTRIENDFIEQSDGVLTDAEIAAALVDEHGNQRRTPKSVENQRLRLRASKRAEQLRREGKVAPIVIPSSPVETYDQKLEYDGDSALILGDLHCPAHDAAWVAKSCNLALDWGIDTVIIGGDLLNADAFAKQIPDPELGRFGLELQTTREVLRPICASFKRVYWIRGNHEEKFFKFVVRQLGMEALRDLTGGYDNLYTSDYEGMVMTNRGHDYPIQIIHPRSYSQVPGSTALNFANGKYSQYHVVTFHEHSRTMTLSKDGLRQVCAAGMCADPLRLAYSKKAETPHGVMQQGSLLWKNGRGYLFTPEMDSHAMARMFATDLNNLRTA